MSTLQACNLRPGHQLLPLNIRVNAVTVTADKVQVRYPTWDTIIHTFNPTEIVTIEGATK